MTKLLAYKNDPQLRKDFLAEMRKHQKLDQIIKGTYGQGSNGDFKGCHIGCAIHSLAHIRGEKLATGNHELLKTHLGIPVAIAYLFDGVFEALPEEDAKLFPLKCAKAIQCGADLSMVIPRFLYWLLADPKDGVIRFVQEERFKRQREAILDVAELHRRTIAGEKVTDAAWDAARDAAGAAARDAAWAAAWADAWAAERDAAGAAARAAARDAAWADAWAAERDAARDAAWADARDAARDAAGAAARAAARDAARDAAGAAARDAAWAAARAAARDAAGAAAVKRMAEKLIDLLRAA